VKTIRYAVMMTAALVTFAAGLSLPGCVTCKAEKNAVVEIEKTQATEDAEYLRYVDHDPLLKPEDRDDRHKLIESRQRLFDKLKKSME
jgi:hypothetical protein